MYFSSFKLLKMCLLFNPIQLHHLVQLRCASIHRTFKIYFPSFLFLSTSVELKLNHVGTLVLDINRLKTQKK